MDFLKNTIISVLAILLFNSLGLAQGSLKMEKIYSEMESIMEEKEMHNNTDEEADSTPSTGTGK